MLPCNRTLISAVFFCTLLTIPFGLFSLSHPTGLPLSSRTQSIICLQHHHCILIDWQCTWVLYALEYVLLECSLAFLGTKPICTCLNIVYCALEKLRLRWPYIIIDNILEYSFGWLHTCCFPVPLHKLKCQTQNYSDLFIMVIIWFLSFLLNSETFSLDLMTW